MKQLSERKYEMLCGDEIQAAVVDIGSQFSRFGASGQDLPRHVFRSDVVRSNHLPAENKYAFGDLALNSCKANSDIVKWYSHEENKADYISKILNYGLTNRMKVDPKEYPLLIIDNQHHFDLNTKNKIVEHCFESLNSPALYMMPSSTVSSFCTGRPTSMVIDIGASGTRINPVVDGYTLRNASLITQRGGDIIDSLLKDHIEKNQVPQGIKPWYKITNKPNPIHHDISDNLSNKTHLVPVTKSCYDYHVMNVVRDIKQWMCFIPYQPVSDDQHHHFYTEVIRFPPPYELPDGTIVTANDKLCTLAESVFFSKLISSSGENLNNNPLRLPLILLPDTSSQAMNTSSQGLGTNNEKSSKKRSRTTSSFPISFLEGSGLTTVESLPIDIEKSALHKLVYASVAACDVDARKDLLANIQVVGGGSLMEGVSQRLSYGLNDIVPSHMKVKIIPSLPLERQHAAWIGGSVLSICGSFQQLWFSKQEYDEYGVTTAIDRFDH